MKRFLPWLCLLVAAVGVFLLAVGLQRSKLPYNEADRYDEPETGIVYHRQAAEVYTLAGGGMVAAALLFAVFSFGALRKSRSSIHPR